jgi:hypothetical protein
MSCPRVFIDGFDPPELFYISRKKRTRTAVRRLGLRRHVRALSDIENKLQRRSRRATLDYVSGHIVGSTGDADFEKAAPHSGPNCDSFVLVQVLVSGQERNPGD